MKKVFIMLAIIGMLLGGCEKKITKAFNPTNITGIIQSQSKGNAHKAKHESNVLKHFRISSIGEE